ncbi:MAG TPA: ferritin-like domain-containing protein [Thermomicrobiales bacterium]|nr:ferritin-like domain-containing protein [Thermomicrobiales bacterium]
MADEKVKQLIDGLNRDLAGELAAVIQYTVYAASAMGIERPVLAEFFQSEIEDELGHARYLADKITALGGTPTTQPDPVEVPNTNRGLLEEVLAAETQAIQNYTERLDQAEAVGDLGLKVQLEDMINDETMHREETMKLLKGMSA